MRLFVTGGTGFIGSHFVDAALRENHDVTVFRRPDAQPRIAISAQPNWLTHSSMSDVPLHELAGNDVFVHLAAAGVSPRPIDWDELFQVNVTESLAIWQRAAEAGIRRFVICGTCYEYGRSGERYDLIPPDAPLEPTTAYGASKAAATMAACGLAAQWQLQLTILRPFHAFGEGQHPLNLWPSLRRAARTGEDFPMTKGEQVCDFIPVQEVARQMLDACHRSQDLQPAIAHVENLGSGSPQSVVEFADSWWKKLQATGELIVGALPDRVGAVSRYVPKLSRQRNHSGTRQPEPECPTSRR